MTRVKVSSVVLLACLLVTSSLGVAAEPPASPQSDSTKLGKLGIVHFPTSTQSEEAQAHFLRGVAALHSFWYPVALEEFRAATKRDPAFMMGYWGEAMAHNHPLWGDPQETDAARQVIRTIRMSPELTARDKAYAGVMERIYREYPDDAEAALFYALALMGSAGKGPGGLEARLRAGAIAPLELPRGGPSALDGYLCASYHGTFHSGPELDLVRNLFGQPGLLSLCEGDMGSRRRVGARPLRFRRVGD